MSVSAIKPSVLKSNIIGKKLVAAHQEGKNAIVLHFEDGESLWLHDRIGIHLGYLGYLGREVDSVEHIDHSTYIRDCEGNDLVRFVTVGWKHG
jgi:hypothetical protein